MKKPTISVIVPIYNTGKFLGRCIDSLLSQTYRNLEVILVDDGSTDQSPDICDDYKKKDDRIHVIHKENGGQAEARNRGLKIASGEYIGFVDSDDWIASDMYETLIQSLEKSKADIACCGTSIVYMDGRIYDEPLIKKDFTAQEALQDLLSTDMLRCEVTNKLFRRCLFDQIQFPEGRIFEDQAVVFKLIGSARRVTHIGQSKYYYQRRIGSSMSQCTFIEGLSLFHGNVKSTKAFLASAYPALLKELGNYVAKNHLWYMNMAVQSGLPMRSEEYRTVKKYFLKDFRRLFHLSNVKQKIRLLFLVTEIYRLYWKLSGKQKKIIGLQEIE